MANDSDFGLSSGVVTNDMAAAIRVVKELKTGAVNVNQVPGFRMESSPFGGVKDSGLGIKGGRHRGKEVHVYHQDFFPAVVNERDTQYLPLTPGPLTTTRTVRESMMQEYSTWDVDYNGIVQSIRTRLVELATSDAANPDTHTAVLMPGSGTFTVESVVGSVIPSDGKLLVLNNGAYGARITTIARMLKVDTVGLGQAEIEPTDLGQVEQMLADDPAITHVAMVHCETTTGMLNPVEAVGEIVRRLGRVFILDAMSSFGGIPMSMELTGAHYLISSANKCIQGVPGFGFVVADRAMLEATEGWSRSHSLDLFDQWREMETNGGKWRFTSPTHVVSAFARALDELKDEGGIEARHTRYVANQKTMVKGMRALGFRTCSGTICSRRSSRHFTIPTTGV
ncbi:MAG: 2-aminoethylphosphonate--pyruvate transaminase [Verrucomicrobiota bacterium]|nr:MAG: 2-aminoethylphosphonate--pyruvate transaminase [Verrucomicrobiota bacterium]